MKYNDNGEYKDIYIKTFDTLPVGTEVDYDGQTVPSGWSEVTDYDTGWVDMSSYINTTNFSARTGQPPMARRIGKVVYWKGSVYCSTAVNNKEATILSGIPLQFRPAGEFGRCGITWYINTPYHIFADNTGAVRVSESSNIEVQNDWAGFTLANINGYLVD